ncbi:hypothetical protein FIBSPDRAFT_868524 [Athelia psychrophila]|uniref:DUF6593 domain-containing protein n=1 Tax=Athelia psychrophila TaxID=1759441 RepID=A0A166CZ28_9AGAM|nr:hypothetical protein FIBSPDRAFT_868524 [Fibularhizoctonia sp. CBS 109695]
MPPNTSADLAPAYNITVKLDLNPFAPLSYITTIKRGGTARGDFVGSFEISMNEKKAFVTMGRKTKRLTNALWSIHGSKRHWDWSFSDTNLRWDCRSTLDDGSPLCVCYDAPTSHQVAIFIPPPLDASPPIPAAALTVFPDGWGSFDEILLSALVLERKRSLEP